MVIFMFFFLRILLFSRATKSGNGLQISLILGVSCFVAAPDTRSSTKLPCSGHEQLW